MTTCSIEDCGRSVKARGWCRRHWERWRRHGSPLVARLSAEERFWRKVDRTGDCWMWLKKTRAGYGQFWHEGTSVAAHRFAYEVAVGPIPDGLDIDHLCMTKGCVRPDHLEPVTHAENTRRWYRLQASCSNGHRYTPENTYIRPGGTRACRACANARKREYLDRRKTSLVPVPRSGTGEPQAAGPVEG